MSFQINIPPSVIAKLAKEEKESTINITAGDDGLAGKKREDYRKLKELEEARKAGTAPAMQDEEGKDINPHIPQYIMQAPWYFGATHATLRHQREPDFMKKDYSKMDEWYRKGVKEEIVATKFRKGACENCGAMTHTKKDCLERPRKLGAKFTGDNIAPDEYVQPQLDFDFEGKRDRWNGYDVESHKKVLDDFQKKEEIKRQLKAAKMEKALLDGSEEAASAAAAAAEDSAAEDDEDEKYADDMAMPGQKFETKQRITVRNLRIREDTAKYLFNLDPNSAFYDPKTRAMRENPFAEKGLQAKDLPYAGDNFVRWSGDAHDMAKNQLFSWEAYEKGTEAHLQADPTKLEILQKEFSKKKDDYKNTQKSSILEKYGGQDHLKTLPKQLLLAQSEDYVEYTRHGTLLKGQEKLAAKSRYEEDVYERNHTSVWGSYWHDGQWGYACCDSVVRQSYCVGAVGKEQAENDERERLLAIREEEQQAAAEAEQQELVPAFKEDHPRTLLEQHLEKRVAEEHETKRREEREMKKKNKKRLKKEKKRRKKRKQSSSGSGSSSESESEQNRDKKLKKALAKEEKRVKEVEAMLVVDERKRPYNVTYDSKGPSDVDIEAFQIKRVRYEDPMSKFLDK